MFAIQGGQEVTLLEWVYVLHKKESWDQNNPELAESTSRKIWEIANNNSTLENRLLWGVFLAYCEKTRFPHSLLTTFQDSDLYGKDSVAIKILRSQQDNKAKGEFSPNSFGEIVAKFSLEKLQTPSDLLFRAGLPRKSVATELALIGTISLFCKIHSPDQRQTIWLRNCLDSMKESFLVEQVEPLLRHLSQQEQIKPELVEWLRQHFSSLSQNSLWCRLSDSAKRDLRKLLGNATYQDFQESVELLLKTLPLQEWEKNQLFKRSKFWSNYSERFERFRILLPSESVSVLGSSISQEDYDRLPDDGSPPTEIGIFDIGGYFIVEFFRGPGSEVRIFRKRDIDVDLCSEADLSIKEIRSIPIPREDVHDHVFAWQSYCEKWLRRKDILPNSGTEYFKGLSQVHGRYSSLTGLPTPSTEDERQRSRKLFEWRRTIEGIESEGRSSLPRSCLRQRNP